MVQNAEEPVEQVALSDVVPGRRRPFGGRSGLEFRAGLASVAAGTMSTRAGSTSSSSATICPSAVRMPVPRSTCPLKAVTVPSCVMVMNVSGPEGAGLTMESDPGSCAIGLPALGLDRPARGTQRGAHDLDMGAAAAEIVA
jgi:hypothetical protein